MCLWTGAIRTSIAEILACALSLKSNTEFLGSFSLLGLSHVVVTETLCNLIILDEVA